MFYKKGKNKNEKKNSLKYVVIIMDVLFYKLESFRYNNEEEAKEWGLNWIRYYPNCYRFTVFT